MFTSTLAKRRCLPVVIASLAMSSCLVPHADASPGSPWWCSSDAELRITELPDVLPRSVCVVDGRILIGIAGSRAEVPRPGYGVSSRLTLADGTDSVTAWADAYGVHVRGGEFDATLGYVGTLRSTPPDDGSRADLRAMATATRDLVLMSLSRVRPAVVPAADALDAADVLVAAVSGGSYDAVVVRDAADTVAAHLSAARARDDAPDATQLRDIATRVANSLGDPAADEVALLDDVLALRAFAVSEATTGADARVLRAHGGLDHLVVALRDAVGSGRSADAVVDTEPYEAMIADLSEYLGSILGNDSPATVPVPGTFEVGDLSDGMISSTASPSACSDSARAALFADRAHWQRGRTINWYYNHSNHFVWYTAAEYAGKIAEGFGNMTNLNDDCGYTWHPNIYNDYIGYATQTNVQPLTNGKCSGSTDGKNIVGWLNVTAPTLAWACTFRVVGGNVNGFDIAIGRNMRWNIPEIDDCYKYSPTHEWDFEAVLTHEFGHALALDHVDEASHGNLTMSAINNGPCARSERTPGYGDAIGLAVLYTRVY